MKLTSISVAVLTLFYYAIQCVANEDFAVVPETQTVYEQEQAVFRCRHTSRDREIRWRVNGMPVGLNAPPEIDPGVERDENDNLVDTLTITATPDYNNSEVVCVSRIERQSMSTPPAILRVLPRPSPPQTGFTLVPESQNATIGGTAQFTCERTGGDVVWRIDGQPVNDVNVVATNRGGVYTLTFLNASQKYNGSEIQCKALMFDDARVSEFTSPAILQLQGPLDPVSNVCLARNSSTLSWTAPFSLDLTDVDPDIAYCIDIYNVTCGRRDLIVSDCSVTEPIYTYNAPNNYIYEYIITPRSNVEGARNGTPSQPLRERFSRFSDSISERNGVSTRNIQLAFLNLEPNRPVPSSYTVLLESLDGFEDAVLKTTNITTEGDIIVVDVDHRLPLNRVWNCTLLAYGCRQNTILRDIELSTHEIQNVSVSSHIPGQVSVTGEFIQGSSATGVLVTIVNGTYIEHHLISRDDSGNGIDGVISGLHGGQYTVSVFVISKDGLPFERAATKPRRITVKNAAGPVGDRPSPAIEYKRVQTSDGVCITCTFLDSSATDCVVVVHQRISQLSSSGLMNIESSHKFTRSGDTAYGCIEINSEDYELRVIDGQLHIPGPQASSSINAIIIGSVLAASFIILVSVTIVILIYVVLQWKKMYRGKVLFNDTKSSKQVDVLKQGSSPHVVRNLYTPMPNIKCTSKETTSVTTESSVPERTDNPQLDSSRFPSSSSPTPQADETECTREEVASIITESHDPSDPQPDSSSSLPTFSLVPVMSQAATLEENVAAPEAEETELDNSPNPGTSADNKPTVDLEGFNNSQVLCVEGTAATGKHEQDDASLYSCSPPKEHSQQSQSLLETSFTTFKEQALSLGGSEESHLLDINNEKEGAYTVTELKPDENMKTVSEDGRTNEWQDEVKEEIQLCDSCQPAEESASGDYLDTTAISEYDSQIQPKAELFTQSTPLKERPLNSDASVSVFGQSPIDGNTNSLLVQNSRVYEYTADRKVPKSLMAFLKFEDTDDADSACIPQPVVSKGDAHAPEDDSAYKTCSVLDDLSYSSEPYSEVNDDSESGHDTKLTEKSQIVCSAEKVPELINDGHDRQQMMSFHPNKVHERPMMENREEQQLGRFFENPENLAGPLVPPQQLSPEGTSHREIREGQIEPESSYYH